MTTPDPLPHVATLPSLTATGAKAALAAAEAEAMHHGWRVCIAVVDAAGHLLAFQRMDGAILAGVAIAAGKARTAAFLRLPSKAFQGLVDDGHVSLLAAEGVMPLEGGVPVMVGENVVGAVGVSGAQSHEDAQVAWAGAGGVTEAAGAS